MKATPYFSSGAGPGGNIAGNASPAPDPFAPSTPTPPAPTPPAPPAPRPAAIPNADEIAGGNANALRAWENAKARISNQRTRMLSEYGYISDTDANGNITNLRVDPNNPYGKYQQMLRGQAQEMDNAEYAQHARGFGARSGLVNQALGNVGYAEGIQRNDLGQGLQRGVSDITDALRSDNQTYNDTLWQIMQTAVQNATNKQQYDPNSNTWF